MDSYDILKPVLVNVDNNIRVAMTIRLMQVSKFWKQHLEPKWKEWVCDYLEKEKEKEWRLKYFYRCDLLRQVWHNEYIEKWIPVQLIRKKQYYISPRNFYRIIMGIRTSKPCKVTLVTSFYENREINVENTIEYDPPYFRWIPRTPQEKYRVDKPIQLSIDKFMTTEPVELWIKVVYCKITTSQILRRQQLLNELYFSMH